LAFNMSHLNIDPPFTQPFTPAILGNTNEFSTQNFRVTSPFPPADIQIELLYLGPLLSKLGLAVSDPSRTPPSYDIILHIDNRGTQLGRWTTAPLSQNYSVLCVFLLPQTASFAQSEKAKFMQFHPPILTGPIVTAISPRLLSLWAVSDLGNPPGFPQARCTFFFDVFGSACA